ncbi:glutamate-rich protein 5 isoform X3 [Cervus canadensis]|uniref:glutamate-rich protein 5 isoform X3 n=1 Tax=Cervus canadensis TaxID=1574408 RepID=UPI001C9E6AC4|nr:glutamate-rich protein 5 isoform X3 [Cervus canadensis]
MGCSSSALNKAGDGNRLRSATEESESCFVQPKPRAQGRESTLCGKVQKESLPPLEKLKISAASTANGVQFLPEQPLAKEAADPPGATEETQPLEGLKGSEPPQPGGKDGAPGAGGKEEDVEAATEAPPLKGSAETEPLGAEAKGQPLITAGERDSVQGTEDPQAAGEMTPLGIAERVPLEAAREPGSQEAGGNGEQSQLPETVTKETESPEILEGSQPVETAQTQQLQETVGEDEQSQLVETVPKENASLQVSDGSQSVGAEEEKQLQETLGKDEQSQLRETIPREHGGPEVSDASQSVATAVKADSLYKTPEGPGNMQKIQPERTVGSMEQPAGILETGAKVEMARKIHTDEEDQHIEGETGETVETEMESEKVSEEAETKEETGEAVDLSAATQIGMDGRVKGHSML